MTAAAYWIARSSQAMTAGELLTAIAAPQALNFLS
jgi:hypothetical protein